MKHTIRLSVNFFIFFLVTFSNSCTREIDPPKNCKTQDDVRNINVNAFDGNSASANYQKVFAVFQFKQKATSYSGIDCGAKSIQCSNSLVVQNVTNKTIKFDFSVLFSLNAAAWNYQNFVSIEPNASVDLGIINNNCASISLGRIQVNGTGVTYQ